MGQIEKSRRLMPLTEYQAVKHLRPEELAGFTRWLSGKEYFHEEEWDSVLETYRNRTLSKGGHKS